MSVVDKVPRYVYFVRPISMLGPVKIGISDVPVNRLGTLAAWSPFPLEIVVTIPGNYALEQKIHRRLHRSHSHKEWFLPTEEVVALVANLKRGMALDDAIDFTVTSGAIQTAYKRGRTGMTPGQRLYMSFTHRLRHALIRAARARQVNVLHAPVDVWRIVFDMQKFDPTQEQIARVEEVIADPIKHGLTTEQRNDCIRMRRAA